MKKRIISLALIFALAVPLCGVGLAQPIEKTVATASVVQTDANLSLFVLDAVDTFVDGSVKNGEAVAAGEKVSADTGNLALNVVIDLFGLVSNGAINPTVYAVPVEGENYSRFCAIYYDCLGRKHDEPINAFLNSLTGEVYGEPYDSGVFGLGFNYDSVNKVFFAVNGCWQRNFGFMPAFDVAASLIGYDYITRRIYFNYSGKEWMVQIWKGNYHWGIFVGGETGIYNRPEGEGFANHYNCAADDEMVPMTMKVYDACEEYIDRASDLTWWMTGFKFAGHEAEKEALTLETSYTFPNEEMCAAFAEAAQAMDELTCTVNGLTAYISW